MRFGLSGLSEVFSQIRRATEMPSPEIAWEDAEQRLGMAMSTLAWEKNRKLLFSTFLKINKSREQFLLQLTPFFTLFTSNG